MAQYDLPAFQYMEESLTRMFPGSIFYFGYLIAQWPAGLAFQKLPVGKFLAWTTIGTIPFTLQGCQAI